MTILNSGLKEEKVYKSTHSHDRPSISLRGFILKPQPNHRPHQKPIGPWGHKPIGPLGPTKYKQKC